MVFNVISTRYTAMILKKFKPVKALSFVYQDIAALLLRPARNRAGWHSSL